VKLLLDQNLSRRLVRGINAAFPGSRHVADFKLTTEDDEIVWKFAADHGFVVISKDSDFFHRALLRGHPPKVIHLRVGNCSTQHTENCL
jgi:predicted nuclease of predicted toxin-antitoxin system